MDSAAADLKDKNFSGRKFTEEEIFLAFLSILEDANKSKKDLDLKNQDYLNQQKAILNILDDLRGKEIQMESILNSMAEGLILLNSDHEIIYINPSAKSLLSVEDFLEAEGRFFYDFLTISENDKILDYNQFLIQQAFNRNVSFNIDALQSEYYFVNKKGKRYLAAFNINPVILEKKTIGIILTFWDATNEKEIDRLKTEFVSVASHQLRTPLTAIKWYMEMLTSGDAGQLNPEQADIIHQTHTANERMIELVNALLNVSRIEGKRIVMELQVVDLRELVESVFNDMKPIFKIKNQELVFDAAKEIPSRIKIDPKLFFQIFTNLLSNAHKYSPKSSKIIFKISVEDDKILFSVSDSGYGIPKTEQDAIFKKFFRASNALLKEPEGNGLGLYIVKSLVELMNGKIWFESEESKGTTFYVYFPKIEK